jgi:hypothetical protein
MDEGLRAAHIDESGAYLSSDPDRRLYVICAVLTTSTVSSPIQETLRGLLLPPKPYLRHYDETLDRRLKIVECLSGLPLDGAIVTSTTCASAGQENARRRLLSALLPRLQHEEDIARVIVESRGGSDSLDRRTVGRLRQSRHLTKALRVDHVPKTGDPLLWIPDFVAGCWIGAQYHSETGPWRILNEAHVIDVWDSE